MQTPVGDKPMSTDSEALSPTVPGTVLAGKYRVERILGQGGMGVVVEARHIALDERVALKFLLPEYATHPEASTRFLREARAAVKIKSEHVARVSDVGTLENGAPYMVMEYLQGSDLSNVLEKSGVLPISDAVDYVIQGCEAIAEAHSYGIVHRDVKPANLFLGKRPNGLPIVKVLDFGISKSAENAVENLTRTTAAMGSALYMSPEQMQHTRGVDHRTDIYALGISLYELVAGRQPFYAETLTQLCAEIFTGTPTPIRLLRPEISEEFAQALAKAYERDLASRYQTVAEFVMALAPFAPPRSQTVIESIAKMANVEIPKLGFSRRGSSPSLPESTQLLDPVRFPSTPMLQRLDSSADGEAVLRQQTSSGLAVSAAGLPKRGAGALIAVLLAVIVLLLGGGVLFFVLRKQPIPVATTSPADATTAPPHATVAPPPASVIAPTVTPPPIDKPAAVPSENPIPAPPVVTASRPVAGPLSHPPQQPVRVPHPPTAAPGGAVPPKDVAGF